MKNQRGLIQIPIFIAIIAGIFVLGGGGYLGVWQYKIYKAKKIKEVDIIKQVQEKNNFEQQAQDVEIEKLKKEVESLKNQKLQTIIKEVPDLVAQTQEIKSSEFNPYLTGVGEITCYGNIQKSGSASIWNLGGSMGYVALTNAHVILGDGNCNLNIGDSPTDSKHSGSYSLDKTQVYSWNSDTDIAVLKILPAVMDVSITDTSVLIPNLNYQISSLKKCPVQTLPGLPVIIIGHPAFTKKYIDRGDVISHMSFRTITNGIISAHDTSLEKPMGNLIYPNYFVSAKIDSGNSGGIAFSKTENGLCLLGIPTWLAVGNYETQGIVQNIHNIFYKQ